MTFAMLKTNNIVHEKYLDVLNILSCLAVIFLHHNNVVYYFSPTFKWNLALLNEIIFYFAVPVFLMISGANLLNYRKRYSTAIFLEKRIIRVAVPYLLWNFIYFWFASKNDGISMSDISFKEFVNNLIYCKSNVVLYFLPLILSCYFLIPIFSNFANEKNRPFLWNLVKVYFLVGGIIEPVLECMQIPCNRCDIICNGILCVLILKYLLQTRSVPMHNLFEYILYFTVSYFIYCNIKINIPAILNMNIGLIYSFPIFILLGYLLSTQAITYKQRMSVYIWAIICVAFKGIIIYIISYRNHTTFEGLNNYPYFIGVLQGCAVFIWIKYSKFPEKINSRLLQTLASCSFGIYLIHKLVMSTLFGLFPELQEYWQTLTPFCTYAVSLYVVLIYRKSKYFAFLFGGGTKSCFRFR